MNGKIATNANEFIELQLDERIRQIKEVSLRRLPYMGP